MSAQTIQDAFAPVYAEYQMCVIEDTWGHLAPIRNKKYRGHIVFAAGQYDCGDLNPTAIESEFDGLENSPWEYEAVTNFMRVQKVECGKVYRFDGYFRNYKFVGTVRQLQLV